MDSPKQKIVPDYAGALARLIRPNSSPDEFALAAFIAAWQVKHDAPISKDWIFGNTVGTFVDSWREWAYEGESSPHEQVSKDIENTLFALSEDGVVVVDAAANTVSIAPAPEQPNAKRAMEFAAHRPVFAHQALPIAAALARLTRPTLTAEELAVFAFVASWQARDGRPVPEDWIDPGVLPRGGIRSVPSGCLLWHWQNHCEAAVVRAGHDEPNCDAAIEDIENALVSLTKSGLLSRENGMVRVAGTSASNAPTLSVPSDRGVPGDRKIFREGMTVCEEGGSVTIFQEDDDRGSTVSIPRELVDDVIQYIQEAAAKIDARGLEQRPQPLTPVAATNVEPGK